MNWSEPYRALVRFLDGTTSRNRRALKRIRLIAAADAAFKRNNVATLEHSAAVVAETKARGPARWVRVVPSPGEAGVTLVYGGPQGGGVVKLSTPGSWLGWRRDGIIEYSPSPAVCTPLAGLVLMASVHSSPRASCWAEGHTYGSVALIPGRTIAFWPGRVEVVGP